MDVIYQGSGKLPLGVYIQSRKDVDLTQFPDTRSSTNMVKIAQHPLWVVFTPLQQSFMFDPLNPPLSNDELREKYPVLELRREIDMPYISVIIHGIYTDTGCLAYPHEVFAFESKTFTLMVSAIYGDLVCGNSFRDASLAKLYSWRCSRHSVGNADISRTFVGFEAPNPAVYQHSSDTQPKSVPGKNLNVFRRIQDYRKAFFRNKD